MSTVIESVRAEYRRYQLMAEGALEQVPESLLVTAGASGGNSLVIIVWHLAGNLRSRFTDFLTSDGEKPWRDRESEFAARTATRAALNAQWLAGWSALYEAIDSMTDEDLARTVTIRGQPLFVIDALLRSLAHASYHVGQIVYVAHAHVGAHWQFLTIPPGGSAAYNSAPTHETAAAHVERLQNNM